MHLDRNVSVLRISCIRNMVNLKWFAPFVFSIEPVTFFYAFHSSGPEYRILKRCSIAGIGMKTCFNDDRGHGCQPIFTQIIPRFSLAGTG